MDEPFVRWLDLSSRRARGTGILRHGTPDRFEGPPYLSIDPDDLRIDVVGAAAVVTFHLGDEPPRSRRTLVFVQEGGAWRIAHLHASRPPN